MKVTRKDLENSIVELIIEAEPEELLKYKNKAIEYLVKNVEIKGFRKGVKIPESILIRHVGQDKFNSTIIDFAIDDLYKKALLEEKIVPVSQGEIKEIISQNPLKLKVHIEVLPKVEIDEEKLKDIKLKKKRIVVTDREVEEAIKDIENRFTTYKEVENEKAELGDRITIDTDGYDLEGNLLETTSMKNYPLVLGSKILVKGFEEQLVGAKKGDELELYITFPKDYHNPDFAGKQTKFKVKVNKLEKAKKPEFTEDFIEKLRGKKLDFEGFKKLIKEEIRDVKVSNQRIDDELNLIDKLIEISKVNIGVNLLKEQIIRMFDEIKENMARQGVKMKDYLESLKMSEEDYKEKHIKQEAEKRLKGELILSKLVDILKIDVLEEEIKKEVEKIKKNYQNVEVLKRLDEMYKSGKKAFEELKRRMKLRKVVDYFFEDKKEEKSKK